jgi:hypothetical protein
LVIFALFALFEQFAQFAKRLLLNITVGIGVFFAFLFHSVWISVGTFAVALNWVVQKFGCQYLGGGKLRPLRWLPEIVVAHKNIPFALTFPFPIQGT